LSSAIIGETKAEGAPPAAHPSHFTTPDRPTWELYSTCIHCGLCQRYCPTYRVLGLEADSPRGRIYQVLQVDAGRLEIGESFVTHIDRCLGCRACETACPSGVRYGAILERARSEIEQNYRRGWLAAGLRDYIFTRLLADFGRLRRWARLLRFYQKSGLEKAARASGLLKLLGMEKLAALAPRVDHPMFLGEMGMMYPATGEVRARVAMLAGCVGSVAFSELNRATIRVLNENGVEVLVPPLQGCCGALSSHAGYREAARAMARANLTAFDPERYDAIVTNSAGCGSTLKEYHELLAHDAGSAAKAAAFSAKVKDVTEFLAELGPRKPPRSLQARVTYQDPCHLAHAQKVRSAPRALLEATGAELVEMPHSDFCCGSAGSYNVTQHQLSMKILDAKMDDVETAQADIIATANTGCMLQLRAGVAQRKLTLRVAHVMELLDECYRAR